MCNHDLVINYTSLDLTYICQSLFNHDLIINYLIFLILQRVSLTSVDLTTLGEAHGMIVDLLADASLPQSVISALKVISDMLSPLLQQSFNRNSFSTSLVTVLEKTQVHVDEASVKDQPDLKDDTPLSLKNVRSNF